MVLDNLFGLLHMHANRVKIKAVISIGILSFMAIVITINYHGIAFAATNSSNSCALSCSDSGLGSTSGSSGDNRNNHTNIDHSNSNTHGNDISNNVKPLYQSQATIDSSPRFNVKDFKITSFGVTNHNPFVVVQGKAGGTKGDESGDNEFGYVFYTDKGLFGAFSAFPNQPYTSSHFTQKTVNGNTCLDKAQKVGHVVISGHNLTIIGININKVNRALTELSFTDSDNGNCINTIYSSKP